MAIMLRALLLAIVVSLPPGAAAAQAPSVLHIKVVLIDADGKATPIPRHALLVSDNPTTAVPRRVVTGLDGTADVRLRPGNYTVESDKPVAFQGKAYQWTQSLDIVAGRDAVLELTAGNAEVGAVTATSAAGGAPSEADPSILLVNWGDSVVAIWTPTTHASGFVIDANGLVATNQRVIGTATSVEVQLAPAVKVAGRVLASDRVKDVAILQIDPALVRSVRPVPLGCGQAAKPTIAPGQAVFTIGVPLRQPKDMTSGVVSRVEADDIESDVPLATGSAGGPVFTAAGEPIGITSVVDDESASRWDTRIVRIHEACGVVEAAEKAASHLTAPDAAHLPVEPTRPFPVDALKDAAQHRAGSLNPYQIASSDFDVAFITPVHVYGAQYQAELASRRDRRGGRGTAPAEPPFVRPLMDFSNWSEYVADVPPVLLIRVTPKLVESFWTKVARGAAQTQGVALPPIKRFKSSLARMQAFCGETEITPIHPFKLEQRITETEGIYEGLYVFDPGSLGPACASVKLVLYSEKEPGKGDTRVVDPKVLEQIWQDFAPYRDSR